MWGHVALGCCLGLGTPPALTRRCSSYLKRARGIWALDSMLGTLLLSRGAWVALGMSMLAPHLSTPGAWVIPLDPRGMGLVSRPKINGRA